MERKILTEQPEEERGYANGIKKQMMVLSALGKEYVNISLINVKKGTVSILKAEFDIRVDNDEMQEFPYFETCKKSIDKYVEEEKRAPLREKIKLENITSQLAEKSEYSFLYETVVKNQIRVCKMKYMSLDDPDHILMAFRFADDADDAVQKENARRSADELRKERMFLEVLCRDYTSVYYFDLNHDTLEILKLNSRANAAEMLGEELRRKLDYSAAMEKYCNTYVAEKNRKEFLKMMDRDSISEKLAHTDRFFYRYQSNPNKAGHQYFEVQAVRIEDKEFDNTALLAFRHIDDLVEMEKKREEELKAREEAEDRAKRSEEEKQAAVAANEMKSRFLSSISHDIRTPVNGIQGMLRIADVYADNLKKQNECREKLWIATDYLVSLVNNVLDMNRLENQGFDLFEKPFNLIDLLMSITAMTDMQAEEQGLHSVVDWKPGYINHRHLIGSAEGLTRILMNLNSNAIKYNKKGGSLYCRCLEKECDGEVAWFEFVNSDTGIGMDPEFLEHAFEPYSQKNNTSLNSMNGVGLGLAIVKQMVERMNGTMKVESKLNEGTTYTILLPFKVDHDPHIEKKNVEHISLKGVRALLVEDNNLNMEIAKFYLEQEQVKVYTAANGQEAVEMFEGSEVGFFDIILMDIMMPIMDGLEATRRIRSANRADGLAIPIIAMSANAFEEDIEKSLKAGMNEHLTKPLDGKKVTDTMKKYLANKIVK